MNPINTQNRTPTALIDPMGRGPLADRPANVAEGCGFAQLVLSLPEMFRPRERGNARLLPAAFVRGLSDFAKGSDASREQTMIHFGDTPPAGPRGPLLHGYCQVALMLAQIGCDDFYEYFLRSFVCSPGGAGDCTAERASTAVEEFAVAQNRVSVLQAPVRPTLRAGATSVELVAEECGPGATVPVVRTTGQVHLSS